MTAVMNRAAARSTVLVGLLLAVLAALLAPAAPAFAHAVLVSSSPAPETVVPAAPAQVVLTFSEPVREVPGKIRVIGPDGKRVDRGEPAFNGTTVTITVDQGAPRGTYLVSYRVISADSHPVPGGYTYSVGERTVAPADSETADRADTAVTAAIPVAKFLGYAGLVLLVGPVLVLSLLWPRRLPRGGPARLAWAGVGLVAFSTLAGFWLQVPYTMGGGLFDVDVAGLSSVLSSPFGTAHLVRIGILLAAALLLRPVLAGTEGRVDRPLLAILAVAGLATWPLAGHPAASPVPPVSVVVDTVHLASMAVWLGGLLMLVAFLLRRADQRELSAILPIWSRWATLAVTALLLAGTVQALIEVGTLGALTGTTYGRMIIAKIALFVVVIAVAAYSRQLVRRAVAGEGPGRMRGAVLAELAITAVVLAVSAALVQITPARTAIGQTERAGPGYFSTRLDSSIYSLQVEIDPAKRGNNTIHVYSYTRDNKPLPVVEWKATAALPASGVEPVDIPLLPLTDNHVTGEINLPAAGEWQLRLTVRISDIDQATVTATVPIT
ncbi:copper transport protein [Micromonospora pattaloongensis]|uniref:Copper transport protein n=2 Tax=Micromonospora pattaloongensis TaxID=405436 RepID=A0A1H3FRQ6_9ACTN|nr:copper transport protein [Micromonospora pattaloongensis]